MDAAVLNSYPKLLLVELTNRCNLRCDYCFKSKNNLPDREMSWVTFLSLRERLDPIERIAFCGMGEQLLHPRFYDMVSAFEGKEVIIITNGTVPIDYTRLTEKGNVHSISFSVDGHNEEIAKKSCIKYNFKNLCTNLERAQEYPEINRGISYVIGPGNLLETPEIVDFAKKYGVNSINLLLPSGDTKWVSQNYNEIKGIVERTGALAKENGIGFSSPYKHHCLFEDSIVAFVSLSGQVRPCCDHSNRTPFIGSLLEKSFSEIWDEHSYERFRTGHYCQQCSSYAR